MKSPDTEPTQSQKEELDALAALPDDQIDTSDGFPRFLEGLILCAGCFISPRVSAVRRWMNSEADARRLRILLNAGWQDRICEMLAGRADELGNRVM